MKPPVVMCEPLKRLRTEYRIGLSAWTDKSMLEEGEFKEMLLEDSQREDRRARAKGRKSRAA
jgi:hypothetical protein